MPKITINDTIYLFLESACADTSGTVPVLWTGHFQISNINIFFFQIKYTEAILSDSTWKLLWFEITKTLIAV